ncbi:MAG TPA: hypothetical protein VMV47_09470 [Bacteroidales bacterium]|nr:hypothetical protein [Bacteroidales bacterium]
MKKSKLLSIAFILSILFNSCGGNQENKKAEEETKEETKTEKSEKLDLKTQDGVIKTIKKINLDLPSEFMFVEARLDGSEYKSEFVTDTLNEETYEKINAWYTEQIESKISAGWRKFDVRINEKMVGLMINETILYAPQNEEIDAIIISTSADEEAKVIKLYFTIDK